MLFPSRICRLLLPLALVAGGPLCGVTSVNAAGTLQPFEAFYDLYVHGLRVGRLTRQLTVTANGEAEYASTTEAVGLVRLVKQETVAERSRFNLSTDAIRPLSYRYDRTGGGNDKHVSVDFDWTNATVRTAVNEQSWQHALDGQIYDQLTYELRAMQQLGLPEGLPAEFTYRVADGARIKDFNFQMLGSEKLDTTLGSLDTIKLKRVRKGKREFTLWIAPELHFVPVKARYVEKDGTVTTAQVRALSANGTAVDQPRTAPVPANVP